jgi:hypothetical protein
MVRTTWWCGAVTRAVVLAMITALIPLSAAASDTATAPTSPKSPTIKASMDRIVARDVAVTAAAKGVAREERQTASPGSAPGFFKSKPGMIALVVLAAGTGYALYSAQNDRIHSAGKK